MKTNKLYNSKIKIIFLMCILLVSCLSPKIKDENMKWTKKFDFYDLYQQKVSKYFHPASALIFREIAIPDSTTILLGAEKKEDEFDPKIPLGQVRAVLFASKDKGQSYKEILLDGSSFSYFLYKKEYSIILTSEHKKEHLYLLNNKNLEITKIDSYSKDLDIWYSEFDGKYCIYENGNKKELVNILNLEERYEIPNITKPYYVINQNGDLMYMKDKAIYIYNAITQETKLHKSLKKEYNYFFPLNWDIADSPLVLIDVENENNKEKYHKKIYNLDEELLYEVDEDTDRIYRYKNFVCDYRIKNALRLSYDYGKTWKTHNVNDFRILQNIFGFYKDEFLVTEGIFFRGDSPESGGRIMVGEFQK